MHGGSWFSLNNLSPSFLNSCSSTQPTFIFVSIYFQVVRVSEV